MITIKRPTTYGLDIGSLDVFIDDALLTSIRPNKSTTLHLKTGDYTLKVKSKSYQSPRISMHIQDGDTLKITNELGLYFTVIFLIPVFLLIALTFIGIPIHIFWMITVICVIAASFMQLPIFANNAYRIEKVNHPVTEIKYSNSDSSKSNSKAYDLIQNYYGDKQAKRSKLPLINHIDEGLILLSSMNATNIVIEAYCLHPILQSDEDFRNNKSFDFSGINTESIILAMEYRRVANSYLSTGDLKQFAGISCEEIRQMLVADKVQNYKDFLIYHADNHKRSKELDQYFNNWFLILNIEYKEWSHKITR